MIGEKESYSRGERLNANPLKQKADKFWGDLGDIGRLISVVRPSIFDNWWSLKSVFTLPLRLAHRGTGFLDYISKKWLPGP